MALFMDIHREPLNELLHIQWHTTPTYVAIRHLLIGLELKTFEKALRKQSKRFAKMESNLPCFAIDGKVLCGSLHRLEDKRAQQLLSVFAHQDRLVLGHYDIDHKEQSNPRRTESEIDIQNRSSASLSTIGSLMMPPCSSTSGTYIHCPVTQREISLGVINSTSASASFPATSTCRSAATSHNCTYWQRCS